MTAYRIQQLERAYFDVQTRLRALEAVSGNGVPTGQECQSPTSGRPGYTLHATPERFIALDALVRDLADIPNGWHHRELQAGQLGKLVARAE